MRYLYKTSFDRSYKKLSAEIQLKVDYTLSSLFDFLDQKVFFSHGLGFKNIGKYSEIRADIRTRILLKMEKNCVTLYFVGNHGQIQKFIRE